MPKQSRITFAWIESRQMKIAIDTTTRYVVANAFEKFASITATGLKRALDAVVQVRDRHQASPR